MNDKQSQTTTAGQPDESATPQKKKTKREVFKVPLTLQPPSLAVLGQLTAATAMSPEALLRHALLDEQTAEAGVLKALDALAALHEHRIGELLKDRPIEELIEEAKTKMKSQL